MKLFQKNLMASEDVKAMLGSGRFYAEDAMADIHDGAIVVEGDLENHTVYAGLKDINVRKITAPVANTDKVVIVDYVGVSEGNINGVLYREGYKTAGLVGLAGEAVRYRRLAVGDTFWLATDNFNGTPEVGKFAAPEAGATTLLIGDAKVEGALNVKIETTKKLTEGTVDTDTLYLCRVVAIA